MKRRLVWFRKDLRVHDHEPLHKACQHAEEVIPFYHLDLSSVNAQQKVFLLECIVALRERLQQLGADLVVRQGNLAQELLALCEQQSVKVVYYYQGVTPEEIRQENEVSSLLLKNGVECIPYFGNTLHHKDDLPFSVSHLPVIFTRYRSDLEKESNVRVPLPVPVKINYPAGLETGVIPLTNAAATSYSLFKGGELPALKRLEYYTWDSRKIDTYEVTRNGLSGEDYATKLSPWLAFGCISPRYIYSEVKRYEEKVCANQSTYWLIFELMWRDFFRYTALRYGEKFFSTTGIHPKHGQSVEVDMKRFELWTQGMTGVPFIDAGMRELRVKGFISNRVRQNVASFLIHDFQLPWYLGAEYFASTLLDYDPCNNYGNWSYIAGVGNDPRPLRYFNILHQALTYDKQGDYIRQWIPELRNVDVRFLHNIYELPDIIWRQQGLKPGIDYPRPVIKKFWKVKKHSNV